MLKLGKLAVLILIIVLSGNKPAQAAFYDSKGTQVSKAKDGLRKARAEHKNNEDLHKSANETVKDHMTFIKKMKAGGASNDDAAIKATEQELVRASAYSQQKQEAVGVSRAKVQTAEKKLQKLTGSTSLGEEEGETAPQ